jgi:hypothetical protein
MYDNDAILHILGDAPQAEADTVNVLRPCRRVVLRKTG